jgi:hypothetical protein
MPRGASASMARSPAGRVPHALPRNFKCPPSQPRFPNPNDRSFSKPISTTVPTIGSYDGNLREDVESKVVAWDVVHACGESVDPLALSQPHLIGTSTNPASMMDSGCACLLALQPYYS